jgi:hypothetical protein
VSVFQTWKVEGSIYEHMAAEIVAVTPEGDRGIAQVWKHPEAVKIANLMAAAPLLLAELSAAVGYMRNARIDLETGATKATAIRTIDGGIKRAEAALAKAGA